MFDTIRAMVNQKESFLETAELLTEEATEFQVSHMFTEADDDLFDLDRDEDDEVDKPDDDDGEVKDGDNDEDQAEDMMDSKISTDNQVDQTDDDDALLSVTLDMRSNTIPDILPVPPMNAGDAVTDDVPSTRVEDGFDDGSIEVESMMTEAITIDDGDGKKSGKDKSAEEDQADDEGDGDNAVTDAIMDKVADSEAGDEFTGDAADDDLRVKLQDRMDKLQKEILSVKDMIKKSI